MRQGRDRRSWLKLITWGRGAALAALLISLAGPVHAAVSLDLYGTFHAMGVIATLGASDDPEGNAAATVAYRVHGSGAVYREGFPLSRVAATRFVGSLFWLDPGIRYDVKVSFTDPNGAPLQGTSVEGAAATRAEISIPAASRSYYVSPSGGGTACSEATPCALSQGLNQAQPGEQVVLRGGTYYQGDLSLPRSGSPGTPIVIRSYPGEEAILDGADPTPFSWTSASGDVYQTPVNAADPHLVLANGERLYPYQNLSDLQNLTWGIAGLFADGTTLYVSLNAGADPNAQAMTVTRYTSAFIVDGVSDICFLNLTFRHYGLGSYGKAIYLNNASDVLVRGCTFAVNDLGIGIKRDSHRNVIEYNQFYDTVFDWPWDAVKAGSGLETGGIRFYDPATGRGTVIRHNTFHDYFDGFGVCPDSTAGVTNETDVYANLVYRAGDDGMETDGQCSNVRIWGNTFHDVLMGISFAPVYTGPVYAIRNLIYRTGVGNNDYSGSPFKFNSSSDTSGPMYLFHNTADAALPGNNGLYIKAPGSWAMIYARNNIWAGTEYAIENYNTGEPVDLDYDNVWTEWAGEVVRWNNVKYPTLADFSDATGQEIHGLNDPPHFAGGAQPYALAPSSPLIDAGVVIPGINDDYRGRAPDIGAIEYAPTPTVTVKAVDARATEPGRDQAAFQITRSGDRTTNLRVSYSLSGSARNGVDYRRLPRRATIKAGSASCILRVKPTDDRIKEGRETVVIKLLPSGSGAYRLGKPARATAGIADNDL